MKKTNLILALALLTSSCHNTSELKIIAPTGAPSVAFYFEADNKNFETNSTPANIVSMMTNKSDKDIVVIDTVSGIKAINKGAPYKIAATITFGNFYIASTGNDDNGVMETDDTIVLFGQNQTPDYIFHYLYGDIFDSNVEYVNNVQDAAKCLASGKNITTGSTIDYVFIAQPVLYTILNNKDSLTYGKASVYKDIQEEYKNKTNNMPLIQASVFVNNKTSEKDIKKYLKTLEDKINDALDNPEVITSQSNSLSDEELLALYGINLNVAKKVIENNNSLGLGYKEAKENKEAIDKFVNLFNMGDTDEEIYF